MKHFRNALIVVTLALVSLSAWAQDIIVNGTVKDGTGEPLIGVSIVQKGTTNGTTTDLDGHFTLKVAQGSQLKISYIGYATMEAYPLTSAEGHTSTG